MNKFLTSNTWQMRLARTVVQAVVAFLFNNIVVILAATSIPADVQVIIVSAVMAVQAPIYHMLGMRTADKLPDTPEDDIEEAD